MLKIQKDNLIFNLSCHIPKQIGWNVPVILKGKQNSINEKYNNGD